MQKNAELVDLERSKILKISIYYLVLFSNYHLLAKIGVGAAEHWPKVKAWSNELLVLLILSQGDVERGRSGVLREVHARAGPDHQPDDLSIGNMTLFLNILKSFWKYLSDVRTKMPWAWLRVFFRHSVPNSISDSRPDIHPDTHQDIHPDTVEGIN